MSKRNWHQEGITAAEHHRINRERAAARRRRGGDPRGNTTPRDPGLGPLHRDDVEDGGVWAVGLTLIWVVVCVNVGGPRGFLLFFVPYVLWFVYAIVKAFIKGSLGMD